MITNKNSEESLIVHDFNLNEDELCDEAKCRFPFYKEILHGLDYCGRSVLSNKLLSSGGKHIFCSRLNRSFDNVKNILNYLATKPLETREQISEVPMLFICGLPRTGTTLLHNLMACDPSCRAPRLTDMVIQPIPPILRSNIEEHKRRGQTEVDIETKAFETAERDVKGYRKDLSASHASFPTEEDTLLLGNVGVNFAFAIISPAETNIFTWFINQQNKDFAYKYHQTVLQMLHDVDPPRTHWQLKSPQHTLWLDTLLKYYPAASIIMTHRRLDQVIPSLYSLWVHGFLPYFNEDNITDLNVILKEMVLVYVNIWIDRIIQFHSREPCPQNILDIQYEDLMKNPVGTVRRIYDHFDYLKWSDEFEQAMRTWLIDNPQGKQGRHSYSSTEFNFETSMNKQLYKDYEQLFL